MSGYHYLKNTLLWILLLLFGNAVYASTAQVGAETPIYYSQKEFRYQYYHALLTQALKATDSDYGSASAQPYQPDSAEITESRGLVLLQQKHIDVVFLATTQEREQLYRPVLIPLDKGLLGLRLLLIKEKSQPRFDQLRNGEDLRQKMIGGFNPHWGDYQIYQENGFKPLPATKYETLFKMLSSGRFDFFSRGLIEVWSELEKFQPLYPDLRVENRFAFYYDFPVYFFVHKDNVKLADRLTEGLQRIQASGAFDALFQSYYGEHIARANLSQRQIILLNTPSVESGRFPIKPFWWPAGAAFHQ